MTAINTSKKAYGMMLNQKRKMEEEQQAIVSISRALDALLGVNEKGKEDECV